ncbi:MAG TPA: hypothetical protein QGF35_08460 [Dehalococcoidia bacterium]|nr:hypothetical protein [Dehalococcoidia bacterium]
MALKLETGAGRTCRDPFIKFVVGKFGHSSAIPTCQVMMVTAVGQLIEHTAVFERETADSTALLEQLHSPENGRTPHRGKFSANIFDREGAGNRCDCFNHSPPRGREPEAGV